MVGASGGVGAKVTVKSKEATIEAIREIKRESGISSVRGE